MLIPPPEGETVYLHVKGFKYLIPAVYWDDGYVALDGHLKVEGNISDNFKQSDILSWRRIDLPKPLYQCLTCGNYYTGERCPDCNRGRVGC